MTPTDNLEAGAGDLVAVAWRYCSHDINGDPWPWVYYTETKPAAHAEVEPLYSAAQLAAVTAERDALARASLRSGAAAATAVLDTRQVMDHLKTARRVLRDTTCPRPANHRPDEFTAGECFDCGECGCHVAAALSQEAPK